MKNIEKMHKHIAAATFFVFLRFASIQVKERAATSPAAKTMEPNAEVKTHLYAVDK